MNKPESKGTADITRKCVTFKLNMKLYTGQKTIASLSEEIAKKHGGIADAATGTMKAMDREDRLSVQRVTLKARKFLNDHSLTWDDNGTRLVNATDYQTVHDTLTEYQNEFNKAVKSLKARWDELRKRGKERVGDLFSDIKFPESAAAFGNEYSYEFVVGHLESNSADVRIVGLTKDQTDQFRAQEQAQYEVKLAAVKQEIVDRIDDVIGKLAATLGKKDAIFRDSLIKNVEALAEIAPSLNVTNDKAVDKAIAHMKELAKAKPDELRKDAPKREALAKKAKDVKDALTGWTG